MGKRRTKKQKLRAQARRTQETDKIKPLEVVRESSELPKEGIKIVQKKAAMYGYDQKLISKDLLKTVMVSGIILIVEMAIYWSVR